MLDVVARVDLATFDDPEFHNRVQRQQAGNHQALQMVYGVSGLIGAVFRGIGALVGVVAVAPVLLPLLVLVDRPGLARRVQARRGVLGVLLEDDARATGSATTSASVLRDRNAAKEVRAFGLDRLPARPLRRAVRRADRRAARGSPGARSPSP